MKTSSRSLKGPKPKFRVGDRVVFEIATCLFHAVVSEDRGPLGIDGRRLYQIQADYGDEIRTFELGEEDLSFETPVLAGKV